MNIRGITVSVGYAPLLERSLDRWHVGLDRLTVVTTPEDKATADLCKSRNITPFVTDIFHANGAAFNKGAAVSEAAYRTGFRDGADWLLAFDADIAPPTDWRDQVQRFGCKPGNLYGAWRYHQPAIAPGIRLDLRRRMPQGWVIGFFMLFHGLDPAVPPAAEPLFDIHWPHGGCYDTAFSRRWPKTRQVMLPVPMVHFGNERENWMGIGKRDELEKVLRRRRTPHDWDRERMENPPAIAGLTDAMHSGHPDLLPGTPPAASATAAGGNRSAENA